MKTGPCKTCERKGCGSYHDECEKYLAWKEDCKKFKKPREDRRDYLMQSTYKSRTFGMFKSTKK